MLDKRVNQDVSVEAEVDSIECTVCFAVCDDRLGPCNHYMCAECFQK